MKENFKFEEDKKLFGIEDYWQSPEEFWGRRTGDCEDYALFAKQVLEQHGIESYVVSFYGPRGYAHTIVIYRDGDRYDVINEDRLKRYQAETVEEALSKVYSDWSWGAVAQEHNHQGWMVFKLQNK
jgi:predicted transglutaminase-like cysteine proteinase